MSLDDDIKEMKGKIGTSEAKVSAEQKLLDAHRQQLGKLESLEKEIKTTEESATDTPPVAYI